MTSPIASPGLGLEGFSAQVAAFDGAAELARHSVLLRSDGTEHLLAAGGSEWSIRARAAHASDREDSWDCSVDFEVLSGRLPCANVAVSFDFGAWSHENYVLMPAAAYNGNRFRSIPQAYPPFLHAEDGIGPIMPVTITDVPRLNDGPGASAIHLCAGDMATPCAVCARQGRRARLSPRCRALHSLRIHGPADRGIGRPRARHCAAGSPRGPAECLPALPDRSAIP
jgi:hypothetical protein